MKTFNRWMDTLFAAVANRTGGAGGMTSALNKVFPRHFSFMFGEIALYSFVVLVATGIYLALFFDASQATTTYQGSYQPLQGAEVSEAYASAMNISFDVKAGLLVRQAHHWAALIFVAGIAVHMLRVYFTGAFRKPREINWVVGCVLLVLALAMGFTGYSLPDDNLSGTGLRIADAVILSIPLIGEWISSLLFGGPWPSDVIIARLLPLHVFVIPVILLSMIGVHIAMLWRQKHTQFPGRGRTESNVVGERVWPLFAMKSIGFMLGTVAVIALLGAFAQINPIWLFGPYDVAAATADAQPDWYIGFLEGALRLMPSIEVSIFGWIIPNPFWPGVVLPTLMFGALFGVPWIERRFTHDQEYHNLLERPRDNAWRTAVGVGALTFVIVLTLAGAQDLIADTFSVPVGRVRLILQVMVLVGPPLAAFIAFRMARALSDSTPDGKVSSVILSRGATGGYVATSVSEVETSGVVHAPLESGEET